MVAQRLSWSGFGGERHASRRNTQTLAIIVGLAGLLLVSIMSLRIGSLDVSTADAWDALVRFNPDSYEQTVVRSLRLPRTAVALVVGGVTGGGRSDDAGGDAQSRWPIPSSSASAAARASPCVTAIYYFGITAPAGYIWFAFAGALAASALVFLIGSAGRDGPTPGQAGAGRRRRLRRRSAPGPARSSCSTRRRWTSSASGSPARSSTATWPPSPPLLPCCSGAAWSAVLLGHQLNVLSLGDETARALGMRTGRTRLICSLLVVVITGAAVAVAGPIGFVGLAVPHMVRSLRRPRLSLGPAQLAHLRRHLPHVRRHRGPRRRSPGGAAGRHRHGPGRRPLHGGPGPPDETGRVTGD